MPKPIKPGAQRRAKRSSTPATSKEKRWTKPGRPEEKRRAKRSSAPSSAKDSWAKHRSKPARPEEKPRAKQRENTFNPKPSKNQGDFLYGPYPIEEILDVAANRIKVIYLLRQAEPRVKRILEKAEQKNIPIEYREKQSLDLLLPEKNHQGIVAQCAPYEYCVLEDIFDKIPQEEHAFLSILDSIVDPQNLGTILRSAVWFGVHGLVIPKDRASPVTSSAIKASAGAALRANVAKEVNLARVIDKLNDQGIQTVGAVLDPGALPPWKIDFTKPVALVIGAEHKGLRPLLQKKCSQLVYIPGGSSNSLNAAQAASCLFYEVKRQRNVKKIPERS